MYRYEARVGRAPKTEQRHVAKYLKLFLTADANFTFLSTAKTEARPPDENFQTPERTVVPLLVLHSTQIVVRIPRRMCSRRRRISHARRHRTEEFFGNAFVGLYVINLQPFTGLKFLREKSHLTLAYVLIEVGSLTVHSCLAGRSCEQDNVE